MSKIAQIFNKIKLPREIQADLLIRLKGLSNIGINRGAKWTQEMRRLLPSEFGSRAYDLLTDVGFDISKLSWRNFERLSNIVSKLDKSAVKNLENLFKGSLDVNRMLIFIENSGSTLAQYNKVMNDIVQKNLFDGTITLSGGKTMSKLEFVKKYIGEATNLIEYYHKKVKGKQYFLKYHPSTNQGAVIAIDSYTKVLLDAESRICVTFTKNEIESFFKDEVSDE